MISYSIFFRSRKPKLTTVGDSLRWPRDTLYPLKLALTLSTSDGRSVGIVRACGLKPRSSFFYSTFLFSAISNENIYAPSVKTSRHNTTDTSTDVLCRKATVCLHMTSHSTISYVCILELLDSSDTELSQYFLIVERDPPEDIFRHRVFWPPARWRILAPFSSSSSPYGLSYFYSSHFRINLLWILRTVASLLVRAIRSSHGRYPHRTRTYKKYIYRMFQGERSIFWEVIESVILSKNFICTCVLFRMVSEIELFHCTVHCTLYR
jgi:hypothetical protein